MAEPEVSSPSVRRHQLLMAVAGALGGLGLAMLLIHFGWIALGTNAPLIVIASGAVFGVALSQTLPPRQPRGGRRPATRAESQR